MSDISQLGLAYIAFAKDEVSRTGRPRSAATMSGYRRAVEGFVAAVRESGLELTELPENFIEEKWLPTQASVLRQPVQIRIRATAVKQFQKWLELNGFPVAKLKHIDFPTPPPKPKNKEQSMSNTLQDVSQLADPNREADPIPSVQSYQPPVQTMVPPPAPRQVSAPQPKAPPRTNPLAAMLPTGQFKLRVRREREMDDPVFVNDYPSERVQLVGAIEPFLVREVAPTLRAMNITGDVAFLVCAVNPAGDEGVKSRFTVTIPSGPAAPVQSIINGQAQQASTREELVDLLSTTRRAQEDLAERLQRNMNSTPTPAAPVERVSSASSEMDELKRMVGQLAGSVRDLSERMESRDSQRYMEPPPAPVQPAPAPQLDILRVIEAVDSMSQRRQASAPVAPAANAPMTPMETLKMMAEMKAVFQPQNIQVDTSPLEEELKEIRKEQAASKRDDITDMVTKFTALKSLFNLVGGEQVSTPKPTFMESLAGMVLKVVENPTPIAEAAERVLRAAKGVQGEEAPAAAPSAPKFPPQLIAATKQMVAQTDPKALVVAANEWLNAMLAVPAFQKPVQRISALLREDKTAELAIFLKQVLAHLDVQVPADRATWMAEHISAQVKASRPAPEEAEGEERDEEGDEEGEEGDEQEEGAPDMTIRVGGAQAEEETHEEEGGEDDSDGGEDGEEEAEEEAPEEPTEEEAPEEAAAEPEVTTEPVEEVIETKSERRKRRKEEKAEETRIGLRELPKPSAPARG